MGLIHAVRADNSSFNARYSWGGKTPGQVLQNSASSPAVYTTDSDAITTNVIDFDRGFSLARGMLWNCKNTPGTSRAFSILIRCKFGATGITQGIFSRDSAMNWWANRITLYLDGSNNWKVDIYTEFGQAVVNAQTILAATAPSTSAYQDIVLLGDGTTTASNVGLYIDGVLKGSLTPTGSLASTFDHKVASHFGIGGISNATTCRMKVKEFCVWDSVIDPTIVPLASGSNGSLNGASRASFVDASSFDGILVPAVTDIRSGVASGSGTGTLVVPSLANTKTGVAGDGGTGTYDGSDRWTALDPATVLDGILYKSNSTSVNETGTLKMATDLLDNSTIETGFTVRQSMRLILAALAGKVSGAPGGPVVIRNPNDTKDRITATVDANGNRTAVTTDVT